MKKVFLFSIAFAALLIAGTAIHGARPDSDQQPNDQAHFNLSRLRKVLGLTDEQVAKIKTEFAAQKDALKPQALKVRDARADLRDAIQSSAPEAQIRAASVSVGASAGDFAVERATLFARIKPLLTPEQIDKLYALQARHAGG